MMEKDKELREIIQTLPMWYEMNEAHRKDYWKKLEEAILKWHNKKVLEEVQRELFKLSLIFRFAKITEYVDKRIDELQQRLKKESED